MPLPLPSSDDIVRMVEDALTKHPNVRLAVFDHITSPTALVLPVARLAKLCHQHNVTVLIDGAHAPGQVPLSMKEIGADFYVGKYVSLLCVVILVVVPAQIFNLPQLRVLFYDC
jgi:isopenicillin-N epimerase